MKRELLERLLAIQAAGHAVALVTDLHTGWQSLATRPEPPSSAENRSRILHVHGDFGLEPAYIAAVGHLLDGGHSGRLVGATARLVSSSRRTDVKTAAGDVENSTGTEDEEAEEAEEAEIFVRVYPAPLRLVLIGAVHIAQHLVPMARQLGYAVTVIDPRTAFATQERFPDAILCPHWPDQALPAIAPDPRTAVVALSHDPKIDDPALQYVLRTAAFYVGALGSRRTHARRLERLQAAGLTPAETGRIHGPVGLAIGAVSPAEIALAILAEITAVRHRAVACSPQGPEMGCSRVP